MSERSLSSRHHTCFNPSRWTAEAGESAFQASLVYMESSRTARASWDSFQNETKQTKNQIHPAFSLLRLGKALPSVVLEERLVLTRTVVQLKLSFVTGDQDTILGHCPVWRRVNSVYAACTPRTVSNIFTSALCFGTICIIVLSLTSDSIQMNSYLLCQEQYKQPWFTPALQTLLLEVLRAVFAAAIIYQLQSETLLGTRRPSPP